MTVFSRYKTVRLRQHSSRNLLLLYKHQQIDFNESRYKQHPIGGWLYFLQLSEC